MQVRNIQLGIVSLVLGLGSVWTIDRHAVAAHGFFQGYTWLTAFVVMQVSAGGLLVGLIMRYADNVVKGFATSLSIVISSCVSAFIPAFNFEPTLSFVGGSMVAIAATILHSTPQAKPSPKPSPKPKPKPDPDQVVIAATILYSMPQPAAKPAHDTIAAAPCNPAVEGSTRPSAGASPSPSPSPSHERYPEHSSRHQPLGGRVEQQRCQGRSPSAAHTKGRERVSASARGTLRGRLPRRRVEVLQRMHLFGGRSDLAIRQGRTSQASLSWLRSHDNIYSVYTESGASPGGRQRALPSSPRITHAWWVVLRVQRDASTGATPGCMRPARRIGADGWTSW